MPVPVAPLVADAALIALIAAYNGVPAIFVFDPVPEDATLPYVIVAGPISTGHDDAKPDGTTTFRIREYTWDVRCHAERSNDRSIIDSIAERIRFILHESTFTFAGFTVVRSEVLDGPINLDEADFYGRVSTVRFRLEET